MVFNSFFSSHKINTAYIPHAVITFKVISYSSYFATLVLCYKYRPIHNIFNHWKAPTRFHHYIRGRYPTQYTKVFNYIHNKSHQLAEWKYFKPVPHYLGAEPRRFALALAENMFLYKITLPITIPFQIWGSVVLVKKVFPQAAIHTSKNTSTITTDEDGSELEIIEDENSGKEYAKE